MIMRCKSGKAGPTIVPSTAAKRLRKIHLEIPMGYLTTHVLDTAHGCPAAGMRIDLFRLDGEARSLMTSVAANADGRCDGPLAEGDAFGAGAYEIVFHAGEYFRDRGADLPDPPFIDLVPVRFGIASPDEHYHVPLLVSPYAYSTYRGS